MNLLLVDVTLIVDDKLPGEDTPLGDARLLGEVKLQSRFEERQRVSFSKMFVIEKG